MDFLVVLRLVLLWVVYNQMSYFAFSLQPKMGRSTNHVKIISQMK